MEMQDLIVRKRDGQALTEAEIRWAVREYTAGSIPDYQMSAFLMAVYFRGLNTEETVWLTDAMRRSGDQIDLSSIPGIKVDKHSTGGVGDKTTLIVGPVAAAAGVPVAKMSGRGLGFSGGTADKLEAIPGYRVEMDRADFLAQVKRIGIALITQTGEVAPADKKLYALRDVTGTVENRSLIASSIMSKKLASGADAILLDVKCGRGAFMKTPEAAIELADLMCGIGRASGKKTAAVITDMDQPLGRAVGNALEVREAVEVLKGGGPEDLKELCLALAGRMICLGGRARDAEEGVRLAAEKMESGTALGKFRELLLAQGGDERILDDPDRLPQAAARREILAEEDGYVTDIDPYRIGVCSRETGAGREKKGDVIDPAAGIMIRRKKGERVRKGEPVLTLFGRDEEVLERAAGVLGGAVRIGPDQPEERPMILREIR